MMKDELEARVNLALDGKISMPCGMGCPTVCCDPITVGSFMPKNLLQKNDFNYSLAVSFVQVFIDETLNIKTTDNKTCFKFEGIVFSEIDTDVGFIADDIIEKVILEKNNKISKEKLGEYIKQVKEKFKETNLGFLVIFSCSNYDSVTKSCLIHETRTKLCRDFVCEQLVPQKVNNSKDAMIERLLLIKNQKNFIIKNVQKTILEAIDVYIKS